MVDRMSAMMAMVRIASHNPAQRDNNSFENSNYKAPCQAPSPAKASALREDIVGILRRSFERPATRQQTADDPRKRMTLHNQHDDSVISSGGRGKHARHEEGAQQQQQRDQSLKLHVEEFVTVSHVRLHQLPNVPSQRLRTPSPYCAQMAQEEEVPTSQRRIRREAHKRMLRNAGFRNDNDFFDISHKEYTEAFAKKIVQKQALQRSLTNHRRNVHPTPSSPSGRSSPVDHSPSSAARAQSPLGITIAVGTSVSCVREALASRQGFREPVHRSSSPDERSNGDGAASERSDSDEGADPLPQLAAPSGDVVLPTWRKALTDDEHLRKKLFSHLYTRKQKEQREARHVATASVDVPKGKRTPLMLEGVDGLSLNPSGGSVFRLPDVSQILRGS